MDKPTLNGCWAKIARAREHNYRLEELAEAFLKRRPNQVSFDAHTDPQWLVIRAVVEPIPLEFSAIAGDLIQNLRSALDLLVWQLVLIEGATPGRHNSFPLADSQAEFDRRVRNPAKGRKSPLAGIDPAGEKWAIIERAQPYRPGQWDLGLVASFSNRDKHQGLLTPVSFTHTIDPDELVQVVGDPHAEIEAVFQPPDALEHDAPLIRVRKRIGQVQMKADPPFDIQISDGRVAVPIPGLDKLRSAVIGVVRSFERWF